MKWTCWGSVETHQLPLPSSSLREGDSKENPKGRSRREGDTHPPTRRGDLQEAPTPKPTCFKADRETRL
ncbi:hypothetical protein scyTo_0019935 [Scyliorhinus torazame]|uniref:Uncharacterized protein n=1 Tax=Scyliorhinus torazame TaxID=75743 RepID=A0A401PUP2_SCYTO|nr:hypothetical protein [Scyliorhinus torazame]